MKQLFLSLLLALAISNVFAQQAPIMVCNPAGTTCAPYYILDSAINAANAGDFIYVPGGNFTISLPITKKLTMIGAGHYPDSTHATGLTAIAGNVNLQDGASFSSFDGIYFHNDFRINATTPINGIIVSNCNFSNFYPDAGHVDNSVIKNCVARGGVSFSVPGYFDGTNNLLTNSFISTTHYYSNSVIANCNISVQIVALKYCTIKNCIVRDYSYPSAANNGGCVGNIVTNCLAILNPNYGVYTFPDYSLAPSISENITQISSTPGDTYTNSDIWEFSYSKNYHLLATSPGHNTGTDSTDMGVYGGQFPYKEGAIPSNPHIYFKQVSSTTNSAGELPVIIKARAEH